MAMKARSCNGGFGRSRVAAGFGHWSLVFLLCLGMARARGTDLEVGLEAFRQGEYARSLGLAEAEKDGARRDDGWQGLRLRALLELGRNEEALGIATNALRRLGSNLRMRMVIREVLLSVGRDEEARSLLDEVLGFARNRWVFRDPNNVVALAEAALLTGSDPRDVLDNLLEPVRRQVPGHREVWLAIANLALAKGDDELAAKTCRGALEQFPGDADFLFTLARVHEHGDRKELRAQLELCLASNPHHAPGLLLGAELAIDSEDYVAAEGLLDRVLTMNTRRPEAWAYRTVIAFLRGEDSKALEFRQKALALRVRNPGVDSLIGRKLSQRYRFVEGAVFQRKALALDPGLIPARVQLAQDLLRLGQEEEGWRLAAEAVRADPYDITAFNLTQLHDTLTGYATLTNRHFVVRMPPLEARVWGWRVLEHLEWSRDRLTARWGDAPNEPVIVEIFGTQKDFGVRTFAMPENPGFLGVCFGPVITVNSPTAQQGHPGNWKAVLFHEYAHVLTLRRTRNRLPRWLSEGISVHEEHRADASWGQSLSAATCERILEGRFSTLQQLSGAFLRAGDGEDLQFAYLQSAMAVDFLVETHGVEALRLVLDDLGQGRSLESAIAARCGKWADLEKGYADSLRGAATRLAPGLDFRKPAAADAARLQADPGAWLRANPSNYHALRLEIARLRELGQGSNAVVLLERLRGLYPGETGVDSAVAQLAELARSRGDAGGERALLEVLSGVEDAALSACGRLAVLCREAGDWKGLRVAAERMMAIHPMLIPAQEALALAAEREGAAGDAAGALEAILALGPVDPPQVHHRLALQYQRLGRVEARREVLRALEETPRFGEAQRLLLELNGELPKPSDGSR